MVERAIILKDAYQSMCQSEPQLVAYVLDDSEWIYLEKLHSLLFEFGRLTQKVSGSLYPTLNRAMTVYNKLIDTLEDFITKEHDTTLKQAAIQGKEKL